MLRPETEVTMSQSVLCSRQSLQGIMVSRLRAYWAVDTAFWKLERTYRAVSRA